MSGDTIFREYRISDAERSDRSAGDRLRHRQKVRESIRENIADIIAEESIIGKNKDRVIKVPLRGIKEYRFVFGDNSPGASQGDGDSRPGQVVGKTGKDGPGKGDEHAGDRPGVDYYETDVTLEELIEIMFEDLELPNLERRALREIQSEYSSRRKGYRKVGIRIRLDKRRTAKQRVMRMLASDKRLTQPTARSNNRRPTARLAPTPTLKARSMRSHSKKARWTGRRSTKRPSPMRPASRHSSASAAASRFIRTTCATSTSKSTPRKNRTPRSSASWIRRARWTP